MLYRLKKITWDSLGVLVLSVSRALKYNKKFLIKLNMLLVEDLVKYEDQER